MHPDTAAALQRINLHFYRNRAAEFSATRERPWPAWERVAELCDAELGESGRSVLDLGCGNGRLGRFLARRWGGRLTYVGLDTSEQMLEIARGMSGGGRFVLCDLVGDGLPVSLKEAPFDMIAAFGLMHHVPGLGNRGALLAAAAARLAPGRLLAVSFWQFGAMERFRRRVLPWELYNRTALEPIDGRDLEEGDVLLAWGEDPPAGGAPPVRYCHWTPPDEADRLLSGLGLDPVASFLADGKGGDLNLYRLLRKR